MVAVGSSLLLIVGLDMFDIFSVLFCSCVMLVIMLMLFIFYVVWCVVSDFVLFMAFSGLCCLSVSVLCVVVVLLVFVCVLSMVYDASWCCCVINCF